MDYFSDKIGLFKDHLYHVFLENYFVFAPVWPYGPRARWSP